ncbi:MAG: MaoC/PaaZ C-terminal domain-containing protein [Gammaproteobacteria bacterium]|nr:MaoC/PaaZ C-terminal domain-containing protein [Gammaproteobacteria bacterium]
MTEPVGETLDPDLLGRWRGRRRELTDTIRAQPVALMRATLDQPSCAPQPGDPLPYMWHWLFFLEAAPPGKLGRDGHPLRGDFLPPVALPRRMWAGGRLEFIEPLTIGETIRRRSTVTDITRKTGRSGELCFVTVRHEFFSDRKAKLKMSEEHDIVYRQAPGPDAPAPPPPASEAAKSAKAAKAAEAAEADATARINPTPVMLFRYSALTFNSHRIHYDLDYCRRVEGFPGLVVHGSLTATLLAGLAAEQGGGAALKGFEFRAISPLYAGQPLTLSVKRQDRQLRLWAANSRGQVAMTAAVSLGL